MPLISPLTYSNSSAAGTPPRPAGPPCRPRRTRSAFSAVGAELYAHPFWVGAGNRHKAEMALKQAARPDTDEQAPAA
ncbi:hypothetical protein [Kitasatospora sp. NPDC088351]|uniref:hypothetical protein n=1 Tax=Kitasatospora sp. NPDC088351 TaxID=3155180 RepID=UPI00343F7768